MSYRNKSSQVDAAAKAGISERTARRIDSGKYSSRNKPRNYRTRKDPFGGLFEQYLEPLLKSTPLVKWAFQITLG